jgi:methylmalonyl-CoA mutase N-terminal domain/subunit
MWAKIVRDKFGSSNQESMKLKFHAQTSGETLSAQQPQNNVVRVTIQAMAAVLGGVQSLHTNSYDEALGLPTEDAVTIALRTQQIIAEESNITKTIDPIGGSYYLEELTDEIESRATEELEKVLKLGGALDAIKSGYIQNEIQKSAYAFQKEVDSNQRVIVGVNKYARSDRGGIGFRALRVSRASETQQLRSLRKFKASRNKAQVEGALSRLEEEAARDPSSRRRNLVELILEATKSKATTGEISNALRQVYGEYRPRSAISS